VGATYVPASPQNPPLLAGGDAGLFGVVVKRHGLGSFAQEARRALRIPIGAVEVRVLPLARIIASKKATGRPKDRAILPALEDALRVLQSRKRPARRSPSTSRSRARR
jgi:rhamnose utilization protein RhaD (predicted bifunctional aldolase and dehydrogenase)